jgi:uncharacterized protein with HEPN domain
MPDNLTTERVLGWLDQMQEAATKIVEFTADLDRAAYLSDDKSQFAVSMALIVIGETAKKIRSTRPDLENRMDLAGMSRLRNRISHGYESVDHETVWNIVGIEIPVLIQTLDIIIRETEGHTGV